MPKVTDDFILWKRALISAPVMEEEIFFILEERTYIDPLHGGGGEVKDRGSGVFFSVGS